MHEFIKKGKVNIVIDGGFGSTGKGLLAGAIARKNRIDLAISNAAPNAGHTYIGEDGQLMVAYHLPMSGVLTPGAKIYICAGAIINPELLLAEMSGLDVTPDRVTIHPRAALVESHDIELEAHAGSGPAKIASTQKGVGSALMRKVMRTSGLARSCEELWGMIGEIDVNRAARRGDNILMEVPQGLGLGLNSGFEYPFCTSREVSVAQALSDAQVHPSMLGNVFMTMRTFPIRVGHIYDDDGNITGHSGPFYPDGAETSWEELRLPEEKTTVTQRVRRVARWSSAQYEHAIKSIQPTHVFLNFVNQLSGVREFEDLYAKMLFVHDCNRIRPRVFYGVGATVNHVMGLFGEAREYMVGINKEAWTRND